MSFLAELSDALAGSVEAAGASVIRVEGRRRLAASGVVWSSDGVIVTADHVVRNNGGIRVGLPDGEVVPATLVGRDSSTDLAVLRVNERDLTPGQWIDADSLKVGYFVLALGRPGRSVQATSGIISALGAEWRTFAGGKIDRYLQTDVVMYPGFSGGPLVSAGGQFAGLNTSGLLRGVSVAVPLETIRRTVDALLAHGRVRRAYLGVGAQAVQLSAAHAEQLDQKTALLLVSVEADSPAEQGGLLVGDIIVNFANSPVENLNDLLSLLSGEQVGASVPTRIVRGGQLQELQIVIGERN